MTMIWNRKLWFSRRAYWHYWLVARSFQHKWMGKLANVI